MTAAVQAEYNLDQTLSILWKERDETGACCDRLVARSKDLAVINDNIPRLELTIVPEPSSLALLAAFLLISFAHRQPRRV